jgi:hypothetical protein
MIIQLDGKLSSYSFQQKRDDSQIKILEELAWKC